MKSRALKLPVVVLNVEVAKGSSNRKSCNDVSVYLQVKENVCNPCI